MVFCSVYYRLYIYAIPCALIYDVDIDLSRFQYHHTVFVLHVNNCCLHPSLFFGEFDFCSSCCIFC